MKVELKMQIEMEREELIMYMLQYYGDKIIEEYIDNMIDTGELKELENGNIDVTAWKDYILELN